MRNFIEKIYFWWKEREIKRAKRILKVLIANKDPEIYKEIGDIVNALTLQRIFQWLESKRIAHCDVCPATGPLRRIGSGWRCNKHFEIESEPVAETTLNGHVARQ